MSLPIAESIPATLARLEARIEALERRGAPPVSNTLELRRQLLELAGRVEDLASPDGQLDRRVRLAVVKTLLEIEDAREKRRASPTS